MPVNPKLTPSPERITPDTSQYVTPGQIGMDTGHTSDATKAVVFLGAGIGLGYALGHPIIGGVVGFLAYQVATFSMGY